MKTTLFIISIIFAFAAARGQVSVALVAGLDNSCYTEEVLYGRSPYVRLSLQMRRGPCLGTLSDIPLKEKLYLQTGLLYKTNGYYVVGVVPDMHVTIHTLDVPIRLAYSFDISRRSQVIIGAGLYTAVNLGVTEHVNGYMVGNKPYSGRSSEWQIGRNKSIQRIDMGMGISAGYRVASRVLLSLYGQYGLLDLTNDPLAARNYNFGIVGGYSFKMKKKKTGLKEAGR